MSCFARSRCTTIAPALLLALCFALAPSPARAAAPPADVEFTPDVVYGKGGDADLTLDISRPKSDAKNLPCVVFIHGGGWAGGDKRMHDDLTWRMAQRGYVSATVGYRFAPEHPFPAQVHDVKAAVRYLRAHADKHGLDPARIGAAGFSAGAHLSMMLGVTDEKDGLEGEGGWADQSSKVQAVVAFFGPTDLLAEDIQPVTSQILRNFLGGNSLEKKEAFEKASPITYVSPGDAPMLLLQGTNDVLVPYTQAFKMIEAMTAAGVAGRAEVLAGLGHGWGGEELLRTGQAMFAFFDQHLAAKPPQAAE